MKQFIVDSDMSLKKVIKSIGICENSKHVQQIAYSSYAKTMTQICFTCEVIRTTKKVKDDD